VRIVRGFLLLGLLATVCRPIRSDPAGHCDGASKDRTMAALDLMIAEVLPSASVVATMRNLSKEPLRVWNESNSWGAGRWRILRIRNGHVETFFQNPDQRFTRNIPTYHEIGGGAEVERKLDINGGNWCTKDHYSAHDEHGIGGKEIVFTPNDTIVVIYDVPRTTEATNLTVWYGVVAASAMVRGPVRGQGK
jgi:hypothetical protein